MTFSIPSAEPVALVMAFDSAMFEQATECIQTIQTHCRWQRQLCVIALDLGELELKWLRDRGVKIFTDYRSIRCFAGAPRHAYAMTCRPYLRDIFPGYSVYMWIDADIRFSDADAFEFYLGRARSEPKKIVICQEMDPTYIFLVNPTKAGNYFKLRRERIVRNYGEAAADLLQYLISFNAGIFAMHRDSPIWMSYRSHLEKAMEGRYDHMSEQDAMNIAIVENDMAAVVAPTIMNWLCSVSMPLHDETSKRWVRPAYPYLPIAVLHLTNSGASAMLGDKMTPYRQIYQHFGLTKG